MALSFLNPWLWLGALALAGPLYLHLRRKREPNLFSFSAVRFLQDQLTPRRRLRTLRDFWLLALRWLAVLLVVAAFTWPYWRHAPASSAKESVVYILDNTLSRQANKAFERDQARVVRELQSQSPDRQAAVIELASDARVASAFGEDPHAASQKVQALRPSHQRGSYLAAFEQASSLLAEAAGNRQRIVLLGDNQANQWQENVNSPPFLRNVEVELPQSAARQLPNVWLADPRAHRIFFGDSSKVNFTLRLGHLGPARSARLVLTVNGRPIQAREIDLENQPGNILWQTQCDADPSAWLQIEAHVEATPDALEADNHLYCAVPPVVEGQVTLLAQSPYLRLALSPEVMRGHWSARFLDASNLPAQTTAGQEGDVLCLESAYLASPDARALLKNYLAAGHGVVLWVNRLTPLVDASLRDLGFEPDGLADSNENQAGDLRFLFAPHSVLQPIQSPDFANVLDVRILQYARLQTAQARPLMISPSGHGLIFESTKYPGKLIVCAFGLERAQTSWPIHPTFIPFVDLLLQAARAQSTGAGDFQPGASTSFNLPAGSSARQVVLSGNGRVIEKSSVQNGQARVRLPDQPGLYELHFDGTGGPLGNIFSVNPPSAESELVFEPRPKPLSAWAAPAAKEPDRTWRADTIAFSAVLQQRIWWWMVLGGLLALVLESVLAEAKGAKQ